MSGQIQESLETAHWSPAPSGDYAAPEDTFCARAFTSVAADIGVDLEDSDPEVALTALLVACLHDGHGRGFAPEQVERWPLQRRAQGLLAISAATGGEHWAARRRCPDENCDELLELDLDLCAFRTDWRGETVAVDLEDGTDLTLRRPTPADLQGWADSRTASSEALARSLLPQGDPIELPADWVDRAEAALDADDPLGDVTLELVCPTCGATALVGFPLQEFLLAHLRRRGEALLNEVHRLAWAYHWSEADILALPRTRRHAYLARINRELES